MSVGGMDGQAHEKTKRTHGFTSLELGSQGDPEFTEEAIGKEEEV